MAVTEGLVFNSVADLNDGINFTLRGLTFPIPKKKQEWITGADSDGSLLLRDPLFENRQIPVKLRVNPAGGLTMDQSLAKIGLLVDLIEECERQADGLPLVWTPAQGTKSLTFYVLSAQYDDLILAKSSQDSGWFLRAPMVSFVLDCKPFGYGPEVDYGTTTASAPIVTKTLASIPGDVPAQLRVIVGDGASQLRRHFEWGLDDRYYNGSASEIDFAALITAGFAGGSSTRAGSKNANVVTTTLIGSPVVLCSTDNLGHVGNYRVKVRVYASNASSTATTPTYLRLTWREGNGIFHANAWVAPPVQPGWSEVDVGTISIPEKVLGTQRWVGRLEAYTTGTPGVDTLDVDYLLLIPTGAYGKGTGDVSLVAPASFAARDPFNQAAGALSGKTAASGGNWTTGGSATDLAVDAGTHTVTRSTTADASPRAAVVGASLTDSIAQVDVMADAFPSSGIAAFYMGVTVRDADLYAALTPQIDAGVKSVGLVVVKAGVPGTLTGAYGQAVPVSAEAGAWYSIRLLCDASGNWAVWFFPQGGTPQLFNYGSDADLAAGGSYASGPGGIIDWNPSAAVATRHYDNFWCAAPDLNPAINSGRVAEVRHDQALTEDASATYYGPVPSYVGGYGFADPAGEAARTALLVAKARRNNVDTSVDDHVTDSTSLQALVTPRYLVIPR